MRTRLGAVSQTAVREDRSFKTSATGRRAQSMRALKAASASSNHSSAVRSVLKRFRILHGRLLRLIMVRAAEPTRPRLGDGISESKAATFETCDELMFEHESSPWSENAMLTVAAGDHDRCDGHHIGGFLTIGAIQRPTIPRADRALPSFVRWRPRSPAASSPSRVCSRPVRARFPDTLLARRRTRRSFRYTARLRDSAGDETPAPPFWPFQRSSSYPSQICD